MLKTEILQKSEKLASATYLVTGYFEDVEPLKWKLRSIASDLVSAALYIKDNLSLREEKTLSDISEIVTELSSLFSVAKYAGLVSDMNYEILAREFDHFINSIVPENKRGGWQSSRVLSDDFFAVKKTLPAPSAGTPVPEIKDKTTFESQTPEFLPKIKPEPRPEVLKKQDDREARPLKEFGAVAVKKSSRQNIIIGLLKKKKEIMIKDVSPLIRGVSEKTIQRELLGMVHDGILRKEGEKRWSRYTLAN